MDSGKALWRWNTRPRQTWRSPGRTPGPPPDNMPAHHGLCSRLPSLPFVLGGDPVFMQPDKYANVCLAKRQAISDKRYSGYADGDFPDCRDTVVYGNRAVPLYSDIRSGLISGMVVSPCRWTVLSVIQGQDRFSRKITVGKYSNTGMENVYTQTTDRVD